jgi:hypothetical protein
MGMRRRRKVGTLTQWTEVNRRSERPHGGLRGIDGILDGIASPARRLTERLAIIEALAYSGCAKWLTYVAIVTVWKIDCLFPSSTGIQYIQNN